MQCTKKPVSTKTTLIERIAAMTLQVSKKVVKSATASGTLSQLTLTLALFCIASFDLPVIRYFEKYNLKSFGQTAVSAKRPTVFETLVRCSVLAIIGHR